MPRRTPKLMRTAAVAKSADSMLPRLRSMYGQEVSQWYQSLVGSAQLGWKKPLTRTAHSMVTAEHNMLRETAERPYFFRKVIKKPKPIKILSLIHI